MWDNVLLAYFDRSRVIPPDFRTVVARRNGDVTLAIADDGTGIAGASAGTGLSIVDALVRDELGGTLTLEDEGGLRAEVVFPAP